MGDVNRSSAAKTFQEALEQLQNDWVEEGEAQDVPPEATPPTMQRQKQMARLEDAIADLEAFLQDHDTIPPFADDGLDQP